MIMFSCYLAFSARNVRPNRLVFGINVCHLVAWSLFGLSMQD